MEAITQTPAAGRRAVNRYTTVVVLLSVLLTNSGCFLTICMWEWANEPVCDGKPSPARVATSTLLTPVTVAADIAIAAAVIGAIADGDCNLGNVNLNFSCSSSNSRDSRDDHYCRTCGGYHRRGRCPLRRR